MNYTESPTLEGKPWPDFHTLTINERLEKLMDGSAVIYDHNGEYDPNDHLRMKTTHICGKCLGFNRRGDMLIEDKNDLENPHYMDSTFFTEYDLSIFEKFKNKDILFSYGVLVEGKFKISLL